MTYGRLFELAKRALDREHLSDILKFTDGARRLNQKQVAEYLGVDRHTAKNRYGVSREGITAVELARQLAR